MKEMVLKLKWGIIAFSSYILSLVVAEDKISNVWTTNKWYLWFLKIYAQIEQNNISITT